MQTYEFVDDVWIVTAYFNPVGYQSKFRNYELFRDRIQASGLNLLTIECVFGNAGFELDGFSDVIQVRAKHWLWQKERLLNLAVEQLPSACTKVIWLDCDILFENPQWAINTSQLLNHHCVVQPFQTAIRLPANNHGVCDEIPMQHSFGFVHSKDPRPVREGDLQKHGHTGFAWAARREIIAEIGLYDACVAGGGDHLIAHAMCGDWDSPCIYRNINGPHLKHFINWSKVFCERVHGDIKYVPGAALHLWHGDLANRQYTTRQARFKQFTFDPLQDVKIGENGCWEWASDKHEMHRWLVNYFIQRKEDGEPQ